MKLLFDEGALEAIAEKAMEKDTGARALRAIIEEFMLDIMYEIPKDDNIGKVTITREYIENTGGPVIDIRSNSIELPDNLNVIKDESYNRRKVRREEVWRAESKYCRKTMVQHWWILH